MKLHIECLQEKMDQIQKDTESTKKEHESEIEKLKETHAQEVEKLRSQVSEVTL